MTRKELLGAFRDAPWQKAEEIDRLLVGLESLETADILRLLEHLTSKALASDAERHAVRCVAFGKLAATVTDKGLFAHYVRALKAADPVLRSTLAPLIPPVNSVGDHAELVALLRSPDAALRQLAAQLLGRVGGRSAFEMTAALLVEASFEGRREGMDALCAMGGHHAVPTIAAVLKVGSPAEKLKALKLLASPTCLTKDPTPALTAIATAFTDPSEQVRCEAILAFAAHAPEEVYFQDAAPAFLDINPNVVKAAVTGLRHFSSPRALEALRRALRTGPNVVRFAAVDVLESMGSAEALPPLVEALGHKQVPVRTRAAQALTRLARAGRIELARTVTWLLRSRDVNVRRMAVEVAGSVPDPSGELWPKLLNYLYDEDWWVRERVIDTLVEMAGTQLVPHLFLHLRDEGDVVRRYYAVEVLKRLKAPEALGALTQTAQSDPDWLVRERAVEAIAALKDDRAVPFLVNLMMQVPELRLAAIRALEELGAASAAPHVALLLQTQGMEVDERLAVLQCLQAINGTGQVQAVRGRLKDPSPDVRNLAAEILGRWEVAVGPQPARSQVSGASLLDRLLMAVAERQGDDLILSPGRPPFMKRMGRTLRVAQNVFSPEQVRGFLTPLLNKKQLDELEALRDVDFSYDLPSEELRFRVNVFQQVGGLSAVFRVVRGGLPQLDRLGLPPVAAGLGDLKNGLVLIGGPTGSGKSTTLAALIDYINGSSGRHIVTFEDPIETVHRRKQSLVNQREIGTHTNSFANALRATLREDPDVILVGELRDYETIAFAVAAAETGHLVFGTVHTVSVATTVDRIINACPPNQHDHMRTLLSGCLRAVVCQYLHKRVDTPGRILSVEVMLNNEAVANLIRKGKTYQLPSVIATSRAQGMQLMDGELMRLLREGRISAEDAYVKAVNKKDFEGLVAGDHPASSPPAAASGPKGA
jgi:twitching motility protein PilT